MQRILVGSLGLALGVFGSPAAGQDSRASQPPPARTARLGLPVALPDTPAGDAGVQPVGLLAARQPVPAVPSPMPPPAGGMPMGGSPMPGAAAPPLRVVPGMGPTVTEDRTASASAPAMLGQPTPLPGLQPGMQTLVPSVAPGGMGFPATGMEPPLYDCYPAGLPVGGAAVGRVVGCGKWWTSAEYLMWWSKTAVVPPLVTTSSPQFNGHLGVGDTRVLLGGNFGPTFHSGGRFAIGRWFGDSQIRGAELRGFFLGQASQTWTATTNEFTLLARPFNNVNPNTPFFGSDSQVVADSTRATGGVKVHLENTVWGAEANYRRALWCNGCARLDGIIGYRYFNVGEKLTVTENFIRTPQPIGTGFPAQSGVVVDEFKTNNNFNGGQIGLAGEVRRGRWSLDGRATVAFGNLTRTLYINGSQSLVLNDGTPVTAGGGFLAVPGANIGKYQDNVFSVIPEVGFNIGFQATERLRIFVGYNVLYIGNIARPGYAIDTNIDAARIPNFLFPNTPAPVPGTPHPRPLLRDSDFFVQGISFGLQYRW
jgi:hypothetical protein